MKIQHVSLFPINETLLAQRQSNKIKMARKCKNTRNKKIKTLPSPQVLQRAAKIVLSGKCPLSKPTHAKLKRHRKIIRKLAAMKGKTQSKKAFLTRHKKQVGGFVPMLPLIAGAIGSVLPNLLKNFTR
jgi:hypothetical protein